MLTTESPIDSNNLSKLRENLTESISYESKIQKAKLYLIDKLYPGDLKKRGKILLGLCPFHAEDTPSFVIYPENNSWHCYGKCSEGGDAISFYMKLKGVDFLNAVQELTK